MLTGYRTALIMHPVYLCLILDAVRAIQMPNLMFHRAGATLNAQKITKRLHIYYFVGSRDCKSKRSSDLLSSLNCQLLSTL